MSAGYDNFAVPVAWLCPTCREPLAELPGGLGCARGHRIDRAREGFVNLLPSGGRRPAGDPPEAVRARRALFDRGAYAPVQQAVARLAREAGGPVLDAGCGEGGYLAAAAPAEGWGIDVSRPAVRLAAKRYPHLHWAVASSRDLPFADATFGAVLSVFAPRVFPEFDRVLRPGGAAILASPGPDHLDGVRARLGRDRREEQRRHVTGEGVPPPDHRERVRYELDLDAAAASDLVAMTPWGAGGDTPGALRTTVDVWVTVHTRRVR